MINAIIRHEIKHEIIVSIYERGYMHSIMIDGCYIDKQDVYRKCPCYAYECVLDDFIPYIAVLYDWKPGEGVRVVWCEDGTIEIETVTVR